MLRPLAYDDTNGPIVRNKKFWNHESIVLEERHAYFQNPKGHFRINSVVTIG